MTDAGPKTNTSRLGADTGSAVEFLVKFFDDQGPYCLTSIVPDGVTTTKVFLPGDEASMRIHRTAPGPRKFIFSCERGAQTGEKRQRRLSRTGKQGNKAAETFGG